MENGSHYVTHQRGHFDSGCNNTCQCGYAPFFLFFIHQAWDHLAFWHMTSHLVWKTQYTHNQLVSTAKVSKNTILG